MAKVKGKTAKPVLKQKSRSRSYLVAGILFWSFWLALCLTGLYFPGYSWLFPFSGAWTFPLPPSETALLLILLAFIAAKIAFKDDVPVTDVAPGWVWLILPTLMAISFVMFTYHFNIAMDHYNEDCNLNMSSPIRMRDLSDFRNSFVVNYGTLPLWPYTAFVLYKLLPGLHSLAIQRLTGTLFDLGTILIIYQIGKRIAGRWAGLYCAAMVVIGKGILYKVISGFNYGTIPFVVACVLWATLRLSDKKVKHPFMWWGILVGLSAYSSFPIQTYVVLFIFAGLLLVLWENRKAVKLSDARIGVWLSAFIFVIYAIYCVGGLPLDIWMGLAQGTTGYHPIISCVLLLIALGLIAAYLTGKIKLKNNSWSQWLFGGWLAVLVSFPALTHPLVIWRIREHGFGEWGKMNWQTGFLSLPYLINALGHIPWTCRSLFWDGMPDFADSCQPGDPFFSFAEMILIVLGLIFCLVKADPKKVFIVLIAALGLAPHFFADHVHSGLLMVCLVPFWIIAGIGLSEVSQRFRHLYRSRAAWLLFLLILISFFAWSARNNFTKVYNGWAYESWELKELRDHVAQDQANTEERVYLSNHIALWRYGDFAYEGSTFYVWNYDVNLIDLEPGAKVPSVVIYLDGFDDPKIPKKISSVFPHARWQIFGGPLAVRYWYVYRCEIPAEDILRAKNNGLIKVQPLQGDLWKRTWGDSGYGSRLTGIAWQDDVVNANQPSLNGYGANHDTDLRLQGTIHVLQNGKYEISCRTGERTLVWVDGNKLFDMSFFAIWDYIAPLRTQKVVLDLSKGDHQVKVLVYFEQSSNLPDITLKPVGSAANGRSLWDGFSF